MLVAWVLAALGPSVLVWGMELVVLCIWREEVGLAMITSIAILSAIVAATVARVVAIILATVMVIAPMATAAIASGIRLAVGTLVTMTVTTGPVLAVRQVALIGLLVAFIASVSAVCALAAAVGL